MFDCNHILDVLATTFFETLSPTRCVVCDKPGSVLCCSCASQLPYIDLVNACPRCGAPFGAHLCTECPIPNSEEALRHPELAFPFLSARAALSYEAGAKQIIRTYKDGDELRLDMIIASFICQAIRGRSGGSGLNLLKTKPQNILIKTHLDDWTTRTDAIISVPASDEAIKRRGFDHMERIGMLCAVWTGIPYKNILTCAKSTLDQRTLGRDMRFENRGGAFAVKKDVEAIPRRAILIDDVLTTGATASAATNVLLDAGSQEVLVAVCARVW